MDNELYTELGKNKIGRIKIDDTNSCLREFSFEILLSFSKKRITKLFINDLKKILELDLLSDITSEIIELETFIDTLKDGVEELSFYPNLDEFFSHLSRLLLRSLYESSKTDANSEDVLHSWLESIRISIEEEIFRLQENL
ncbi:MAG: hypothetical protein H6622_06570 [Halobacteriovoraceae bacterium]|nr:hypothetical protein [Halobacteriovoraceae bacterium]